MMKSISLFSLSAIGIVAAGLMLTGPALASNESKVDHPARATSAQPAVDRFWSSAEFENDDDDNRRYGNLPRPSRAALSGIGITRVLEVEWDDGRIEVEGLDARGREVDVIMDRTGQRIIRHKVERWDD